MQLRGILVVAALASLAAGGPACTQDAPWQQYNGLNALEIPFANGPISTSYVPEVWLKLPGSAPRRFGMDTGSTGIVVAADHYTPGPGDVAGGPGRLVYNSSGRILNGTYYTTDVVIQRDGSAPLATARVQVLRVTSITCLERGRDCRPEQNPRDVAFMGIGFDRESAQGTEGTTPRNPFTNLVSLASGAPLSSIRPGYIVTRTTVHLGMTAELTHDFAFVKLQPSLARRPHPRPDVPRGLALPLGRGRWLCRVRLEQAPQQQPGRRDAGTFLRALTADRRSQHGYIRFEGDRATLDWLCTGKTPVESWEE